MSDDFVELAGNIGEGLGLSKAACRLYALLYIKGKPLSLDKMSEELGMSKGSVSVNIRNLERWEAVKKVWKKGSRKDYYRAEEDIERIVLNRVSEGMGKRIELLKEYVDKNKDGEKKEQVEKLEVFIERTGKTLNAVKALRR